MTDKQQKPRSDFSHLYDPSIYIGIKTLVPLAYTQYAIKRIGLFRKRALVRVCSGVGHPLINSNIDLSVFDTGAMIGSDEAIEMYKSGSFY